MTAKAATGVLAVAPLLVLAGCVANMPTQPSQIIGSYTSGIKYESVNCSHHTVLQMAPSPLCKLAAPERGRYCSSWPHRES